MQLKIVLLPLHWSAGLALGQEILDLIPASSNIFCVSQLFWFVMCQGSQAILNMTHVLLGLWLSLVWSQDILFTQPWKEGFEPVISVFRRELVHRDGRGGGGVGVDRRHGDANHLDFGNELFSSEINFFWKGNRTFSGGNQENLVFPPNFENYLKMFMNGVSGIVCC